MTKAVKKSTAKSIKKLPSPFQIYWEKQNYILLIVGVLMLIIGYYVMSIGSWDSFTSLVVSPIILFIAYVLIFPASILLRKKSDSEKENNTQ